MSDTYTTTTHQSWGSRLASSVKNIAGGALLAIICVAVLVWNEGNSVEAHKSLKEAEGLCVDLPSATAVDATLEGRLVHVSAMAEPTTPDVVDTVFAVYPTPPALKLQRKVETYQWTEEAHTETEKNTGGSTDTTTTYTYSKGWEDHIIDSDAFAKTEGHENPTEMLFQSRVQSSNAVKMGEFDVPSLVLDKMRWYEPLRSSNYSTSFLSEETVGGHAVTLYEDVGYYFGNSPSSPAIGDTRVSFSYIPEQVISVVARQSGSSFSNFVTSNGRQVLLVEPGTVSAQEMFVHANQQVTIMTWMIRFFGFLLLWMAFKAILDPISVFADVIPFLGNLLEAGASVVSFLAALVVATVVIAVSWLAYRPLLSLCLLGGVALLARYIWNRRRQQHPTHETAYAVAQGFDLEMQPGEKW